MLFVFTEARTKGNEFKLQQEGLKLNIKGEKKKELPDAKASEIMEHIIERSVEAYPWRCLRINIYLSGAHFRYRTKGLEYQNGDL